MNNLVPLSDFVLRPIHAPTHDSVKHHWETIEYARLLQKKLELWMIVPCDENGNVLEEPRKEGCGTDHQGKITFIKLSEQYQMAKERMLFNNGHDYRTSYPVWIKNETTLEFLALDKSVNLKLSETAKKIIKDGNWEVFRGFVEKEWKEPRCKYCGSRHCNAHCD